MKKITAVFLVMFLVLSGFAGLIALPTTPSVAADTGSQTITLDAKTDDKNIAYYPDDNSYYDFTIAGYNSTTVGYKCAPNYANSSFKELIQFNTSSIPSDIQIQSATLYIKAYSYGATPLSTVQIYSGDFGASIGSEDFWKATTLAGSFTFNGFGWYSVSLNPSTLGTYQFAIQAANNWTAVTNDVEFYGAHGDSYHPYIVLSYTSTSGGVSYELTDGTSYDAEFIPIISEFNNSYNLYTYEFDTFTGVNNISLATAENWNYLGMNPGCNSTTSNSTSFSLFGVVNGVTYRVYFAVPVVKSATAYVTAYNANTGVGFTFESFKMMYCAGSSFNQSAAFSIYKQAISVTLYSTYTIAVFDYFGNLINTQTFTANGAETAVSIPLDVYSFKTFNQQEDFVKFRIYYNNSGSPITYYNSPSETVEQYLRAGNYTILATYYSNGTAGNTESFSLEVSDAEYLMIKGNTISRVISDVSGVYSLQKVLTNLVTPDVAVIAENMPCVPLDDGTVQYIHPWSIFSGSITNSYSGTSVWSNLTTPDYADGNVTVLTDSIYINGVYNTKIWVNESSGIVASSTTLPFEFDATGQNLTIEASGEISVKRDTTYRFEQLFYFSYYSTQKMYYKTLSITNPSEQNWTNINWFVGFPENRSINQSSVAIHDSNNDVDLEAGLNFDVTYTGIRMAFDTLAANETRTFSLYFYDPDFDT